MTKILHAGILLITGGILSVGILWATREFVVIKQDIAVNHANTKFLHGRLLRLENAVLPLTNSGALKTAGY